MSKDKKKEDEFDPSSTIAMFIASALQHPNPECNGGRRRMSTIHVAQHKNKFDLVVVYCTLAETNEVHEAWAEEGKSGLPDAKFLDRCLDHDADLYRKTYRKIMFLAPQYKAMTLGRPDYGYLLFDTKQELDEWLDNQGEYQKTKNVDDENLQRRWNCGSADELRAKLYKVYDNKYPW